MKKICRICNTEKDLIDFPFRKDTNNYRSECIDCYKELRKKYKNNPERNRADQKKHYDNNKEKVKKRVKAYKESKKSDPKYILIKSLRRRLYNFVKRNSKFTNQSTIKLIGCSQIELKDHIQSLFKEGMTWENYGYYGWHIDHKIPLSKAKTNDELYLLCHYTNLQPMWWKENLSKHDKILLYYV